MEIVKIEQCGMYLNKYLKKTLIWNICNISYMIKLVYNNNYALLACNIPNILLCYYVSQCLDNNSIKNNCFRIKYRHGRLENSFVIIGHRIVFHIVWQE